MADNSESKDYRDTVYFYIMHSFYVYAAGVVILVVAGHLSWFLGFTFGSFGAILIFRVHSLTTIKIPEQRKPALYMRFHYILRLLLFAVFVIIAAQQKRVNVYTTIVGLFIVKISIYLFKQK